MKMKIVLGGCILALLAAASVAAYAQMRTTEITGTQNAERVVDAEGNLRVPADYRAAYQFSGHGPSQMRRVRVRKRCTWFMRHLARSRPISKMDGSQMALCW